MHPFCYCVTMEAIPKKWIFACVDCGCIFTTMAEKQTGICPVCKSSVRNDDRRVQLLAINVSYYFLSITYLNPEQWV